MAKSLNKLKGKKEWKWEKEHQKAFKELKEKITSQPVFSLPRREEKFRVETDTSGYAIGGVVVATTRQNGTCDMLTSAKLSVGYLVVGITRELNKEPSLYYPLYIYMAPVL